MRIITRQELAVTIAEDWKKEYLRDDKWLQVRDRSNETRNFISAEVIYKRLVRLGKSPNPDKVDEVLHNQTWTTKVCDKCNQFCMPVAIEFGYEGWTETCCPTCLRTMMQDVGIAEVETRDENLKRRVLIQE